METGKWNLEDRNRKMETGTSSPENGRVVF
jgi:hypothetical protein